MKIIRCKYQLGIIAASVIFLIIGYTLILSLTDSIIINYDVYSSTRHIADDPGSIVRRVDQLTREVGERQEQRNLVLAKKAFSQDVLRELASVHHGRLVQLDNRNSPVEDRIIFDVAYTGTVTNMLNLLNSLETGYLVRIDRVALRADDENGARVRMMMTVTGGDDEITSQ